MEKHTNYSLKFIKLLIKLPFLINLHYYCADQFQDWELELLRKSDIIQQICRTIPVATNTEPSAFDRNSETAAKLTELSAVLNRVQALSDARGSQLLDSRRLVNIIFSFLCFIAML